MSDFTDALDDLNQAQKESFGVPFLYQAPGSLPLAATGVRLRRAPEGIADTGSFEGLTIREADFAVLPVIGAAVMLSGAWYVVSDMHDPYPYDGSRTLILNRRKSPNG